jgi:hypothetical protein
LRTRNLKRLQNGGWEKKQGNGLSRAVVTTLTLL